jgi:hypothetical protein
MVITFARFALLILSFFCLPLCAADVKVEAEIDTASYADEPLKGTITITHDRNQTIDNESFVLGKNSLSVSFVKDVQISPNDPLILSIYNFTLPAQPEGLYALPNISVKIGGQTYQSPMASYTVQAKRQAIPAAPSVAPQPAPSAASSTPAQPLLHLEASIDGSDTLYPGQRTKFVYHYLYRGDIKLLTEKLPLLDAEGFIKIGEKEINNYVQGDISIMEIVQQVEAVSPGKFSLGPSLVEGQAASGKLSSEAPAVAVTVLPFPEQDKPASFNGAVGQFTFKTSLLSSSEMTLGDELSLGLIISGKGNLKELAVSDLCCQPGISGFFRLSDLPPTETIEGDTKTIVAKFRPLNSLIKEIPSLEFSFFDPTSSKYVVLHSNPIPISIKPGPAQIEEPKEEQAAPEPKPEAKEQQAVALPALIQIESTMPLQAADLHNKPFGTWWSMAILPFAILLMIYQSHLKEYLEWKQKQKSVITPGGLFQQAFADQANGKCDFELLKKAFYLALAEAGLLPSPDISDQELPDEGLAKEVKLLLASIDEKRFTGNGVYDVNEIQRLSQTLMNKIYAAGKPQDQGAPL